MCWLTRGIMAAASLDTWLRLVKEKYKEYLYIEIMPEESKNAAFYQRFGFEIMPDGVAMQICNPGKKDKKVASVF